MSALSRPEFHDEAKAFTHLESIVWADGAVCPHCGAVDRLTKVTANPAKRIREGLWRCGHCKGQFTAKVGTVFEHARIPLHKMLQAVYLMTSSKKGISAHQLHRVLEITYKSAWFLAHRIREAMRSDEVGMFGAGGGIVEADETFIGREPGVEAGRGGFKHKMKVLSLLDRATGARRSFVIDGVTMADVTPILQDNIAREAHLLTDDAGQYRFMYRHFASHRTTPHMKGVYVDRDNPEVHTNTIEGSFSIFKRGMRGVYQHCQKHHLHRYLAEFDFRHSHRVALGYNDGDRSNAALVGIVGKRLTYKSANFQKASYT
jgi:transposase-like protein